MSVAIHESRRNLLRRIPTLTAGLALVACRPAEAQENKEKKEKEEEAKVTPGEDLMSEHGVLARILLIYEEAIRRLNGREEMSPDLLHESATIIRTFIADYHEKNEEQYLFPRLEKANQHVQLVRTLKAQHVAGRKVTDEILRLAKATAMKEADERRKLIGAMHAFIRMYQPHKARENTVLFPAFRKLLTGKEYDALGEEFEHREHQLFGENGFEHTVDQVAAIEKKLGIYDLAQFTPK